MRRAAAAAGHEVTVVAGSVDSRPRFRITEEPDPDPTSGAPITVPAVVRLNDHTTTCLLALCVHPGDRRPCPRAYSPFEPLRSSRVP